MIYLVLLVVVALVAYRTGVASNHLPRKNKNMIHWVCATCEMEATVHSTAALQAVAEAHNEHAGCEINWTPNTLPRSLTGK